MHVDKSSLDAFRATIAMQAGAARNLMETSIAEYLRRNPGAPVADVREYALALADTTEYVYGQAAAAATAQLYDRTAEALGLDLDPAALAELEDAGQAERVIRYQAGKLAEGDYAGFGAAVGRYLADRVLRTSWQTVIDNADRPRDRKLGIRYARVPTGARTCGFCIMLASRGFVYRSRRLAGELGPGVRFNSFHNGCDCLVVAGDESTTVEGYEPDKMYEAYADARDTVRSGDWKRIVAELNTRAPQWAYRGEPGRVSRDDLARPSGLELATAGRLASHGFDVHFRETRSQQGKHTSDVYFLEGGARRDGGVRQRWEFKRPTGTGRQTIYHQFEEAAVQAPRLVLDVTDAPHWTDERLEAEFERVLDRYHYTNELGEKMRFSEVLVVRGDKLWRRKRAEG